MRFFDNVGSYFARWCVKFDNSIEMAESAYHNEALRRQRAIERKKEAQRRILEGVQVCLLM